VQTPTNPMTDMNLVSELLRGGITLASVMVGGVLSAAASFWAFRRQAAHQDKSDQEKHRRDLLRERLKDQRDAYEEYLRLMGKHQQRTPISLSEGVVKKVARQGAEEAEAHADAVALWGKLVIAFGDETFASEISDNIEMASAARGEPILEGIVATVLGNEALKRMRQAMASTERSLGIPELANIPAPTIPSDVRQREKRKAYVTQILRERGVDQKRIDQILSGVTADSADKADSQN